MGEKKLPIKLPQRALTNIDLGKYVKKLRIRKFRGIFMRNELPLKIYSKECGIINMDDSNGPGTHWTAYVKKKQQILYFDSMGKLKPPKEVVTYFHSNGGSNNKIKYNNDRVQKYNSINCGHLCLKFLYVNTL